MVPNKSRWESLSLVLVLSFIVPAAHCTIVNTLLDEDDGSLGGGSGISLREATRYSADGATITFDAALSGQTIRLTGGRIIVGPSQTIDASALPDRITLSGDRTGDGKTADDSGVLMVLVGAVVLDSVIITGGYGGNGGGILNDGSYPGATLHLRNSTITGNYAAKGAGIYYFGGGSGTPPLLTIENSIIAANVSPYEGGGLWVNGAYLIRASTFSGNSAGSGGAILADMGSGAIEDSTISENTAINGNGAGIYCKAPLAISNSTVCGNSAENSGGGIYNSGTLTANYTTITGNYARLGGGGIYRGNTLNIQNSIIAGNVQRYLAVSDISFPYSGARNLISVPPLLAPLGSYGGLTQTMPPLPGSPAINAGGATTLTTDQRGRPRIGTPDIGAAEYQGNSDLSLFWPLDFDSDGSPFGVEQALGTDNFTADPANANNLGAPTFDPSGSAILHFGIGTSPFAGTCWILSRSPDLTPGSFTEIYRYDGSSDSASPGINFNRSPAGITITDTSPLPGSGYYRLGAQLTP